MNNHYPIGTSMNKTFSITENHTTLEYVLLFIKNFIYVQNQWHYENTSYFVEFSKSIESLITIFVCFTVYLSPKCQNSHQKGCVHSFPTKKNNNK